MVSDGVVAKCAVWRVWRTQTAPTKNATPLRTEFSRTMYDVSVSPRRFCIGDSGFIY